MRCNDKNGSIACLRASTQHSTTCDFMTGMVRSGEECQPVTRECGGKVHHADSAVDNSTGARDHDWGERCLTRLVSRALQSTSAKLQTFSETNAFENGSFLAPRPSWHGSAKKIW